MGIETTSLALPRRAATKVVLLRSDPYSLWLVRTRRFCGLVITTRAQTPKDRTTRVLPTGIETWTAFRVDLRTARCRSPTIAVVLGRKHGGTSPATWVGWSREWLPGRSWLDSWLDRLP